MAKKLGLVVEGGGLRAIYNAGVLDRFNELRLEERFDYVIGSSAGAANASSFLAGQTGRNKRVIINYLTTDKFSSGKHLLRLRPMMDLDFLFKDVAFKLDPLDIKAMLRNPADFEVTATDVLTGRCIYIEKKARGFITAAKASCALPMLFQDPIPYKGYALLDGGISDPIPVRRAVMKGCRDIVVIMTQHKGYRKTPAFSTKLLWLKYRRHKAFMSVALSRPEIYNASLDYISDPPKGIRTFPIYPSTPIKVAHLEKDKGVLNKVWSLGYRDAKRCEGRLMKFLGQATKSE